jgi:hypothetical protein
MCKNAVENDYVFIKLPRWPEGSCLKQIIALFN